MDSDEYAPHPGLDAPLRGGYRDGVRTAIASLFLLAACAARTGSLYEGATLPSDETALVEVNTYAQKRTIRWVVREVRLTDGPKVRGTFDVKPGPRRIEVTWQVYDAGERPLLGALLLPVADRAKRIDEGVAVFQFDPVAGRLYRLQWSSRADASIEGDPKDMELTLVDAGLRPRE